MKRKSRPLVDDAAGNIAEQWGFTRKDETRIARDLERIVAHGERLGIISRPENFVGYADDFEDANAAFVELVKTMRNAPGWMIEHACWIPLFLSGNGYRVTPKS